MDRTAVGSAEASPYTMNDVGSGGLSGHIEIVKQSALTTDPLPGTYLVTLTATDAARVIHTSGMGTMTYDLDGLTSADTNIGSTGLAIKLGADAPAQTDVGSSVIVNIVFGGSGAVMYSMPDAVPTVRATLTAFTKRAGSNHGPRACEFKDVSLSGANIAITDNEYSPTEISFVINTPADGSTPYKYFNIAAE